MKRWLTILIQILLLGLFISSLSNIIAVKYFSWGFIPISESTSEMFYDFSMSYLVAYLVYFFTVFPTFISNNKKRKVIHRKLNTCHKYIAVRLEKIDCLIDDKEEFKKYLSLKKYSDTLIFPENSKNEFTYYELFNQIDLRIARLSEIQSLVISINEPELYNTLDKVLNHKFRRTDNLFLKNKFEDLTKKQMKIEVGASLYNLFHEDLPKAIEASKSYLK
jgi:hypothetical protein